MRIVSGRFRGRCLHSPAGAAIRPTGDRVREAMFNVLAACWMPAFKDVRVLDLFAGTGALGLEALSRGASHVTFVDTGAEARGLIRDHIDAFGVGGVTKLLRRDATNLGKSGTFGQFSLVFLDPPYGRGLGEKALEEIARNGWLAKDVVLVFEESVDADIILPSDYRLDDRRLYGATAVHFLHYGQG